MVHPLQLLHTFNVLLILVPESPFRLSKLAFLRFRSQYIYHCVRDHFLVSCSGDPLTFSSSASSDWKLVHERPSDIPLGCVPTLSSTLHSCELALNLVLGLDSFHHPNHLTSDLSATDLLALLMILHIQTFTLFNGQVLFQGSHQLPPGW